MGGHTLTHIYTYAYIHIRIYTHDIHICIYVFIHTTHAQTVCNHCCVLEVKYKCRGKLVSSQSCASISCSAIEQVTEQNAEPMRRSAATEFPLTRGELLMNLSVGSV